MQSKTRVWGNRFHKGTEPCLRVFILSSHRSSSLQGPHLMTRFLFFAQISILCNELAISLTEQTHCWKHPFNIRLDWWPVFIYCRKIHFFHPHFKRVESSITLNSFCMVQKHHVSKQHSRWDTKQPGQDAKNKYWETLVLSFVSRLSLFLLLSKSFVMIHSWVYRKSGLKKVQQISAELDCLPSINFYISYAPWGFLY